MKKIKIISREKYIKRKQEKEKVQMEKPPAKMDGPGNELPGFSFSFSFFLPTLSGLNIIFYGIVEMGKLTVKELEMLRGVGDALMNYGNAICTKPSKPYKASKSQSLQQHIDTRNAFLKIEADEGVTEDTEMVEAWLAFRNKLNSSSTAQ